MESRFLLLLVLSWGAMACSTRAPVQAGAEAEIRTSEFVVRPGNILRVRIWPDSALGGNFPVEESGKVHLPVIGEVDAGGIGISALRRELRDRYAQALRAPVVSVTPLFEVSVLGAVQRPGLYQIDPSQDLFGVISQAGGFRSNARESNVRVLREGELIEVNARSALEGDVQTLDLALRTGDRIIVPEGWGISARDVLYVLQTAVLVFTLIDRAGGSS